MQIDKNILMGDLLRMAPGTSDILMQAGMGWIFCPSAQVEAVGEAAAVHGVDADALVDRLNAYLATLE